MPSQTQNLGLIKPTENETYDINIQNTNMDLIDKALVNISVPDASLTQKGIVQLSSVTNGTSENKAPTEKALGIVMQEATAAKQAGNDRKAEVVAALVAKGVAASTSDTWAQLISKMTAIIVATGDATAADLLSGKTASNKNGPITGNIPVLTGVRVATGVGQWGDGGLAVYPEKGYQSGGAGGGEIKVSTAQLQQADPDLHSNNIVNTANIYGVQGGIPLNYPGIGGGGGSHFPAYNISAGAYSGDGKTYAYMMPTPGGSSRVCYQGDIWIRSEQPFLRPEYIVEGAQIMNVGGTAKQVGMQSGGTVIGGDAYPVYTSGTQPIAIRRYQMTQRGTYRVSFELQAGGITSYPRPVHCQIYRSGNPITQVYTVDSPPAFVPFAVDLFFNIGDTCEFYVWIDSGINQTGGTIQRTHFSVLGGPILL